ncbi:uncharacterized protein C1orf115 homolog [Esox lucius]|uniref:Uncharacterized protein n=1 Tax=Esox lucius TaxID=8010 RepID=A0AAY5K261_ESOLU|nr:uncharacterized protein C1orf115 homolog [Esox lucius]
MLRRKCSKSNNKSFSSASEELTRIVEFVELQYDDEDGEKVGGVDRKKTPQETAPWTRDTGIEGERDGPGKPTSPTRKTSREVHIAFLPDRYKPLLEEQSSEGIEERIEGKKKRTKEKHKKYRKNVGKALRFGWKCLVAGLQSLASGYATPLSATATLVTNVHRTNR